MELSGQAGRSTPLAGRQLAALGIAVCPRQAAAPPSLLPAPENTFKGCEAPTAPIQKHHTNRVTVGKAKSA